MYNHCRTALSLLFCFSLQAQVSDKQDIAGVLDAWHQAAAAADYEAYFDAMTPDAVFIGTDATEYWAGAAFREFSKPYFDRGKAWNFRSVERHIYLGETGKLAWFDELLDTRMGLCRGSGTLIQMGGRWKISHYVLSIAVPNDDVPALIELKKESDSLLLRQLLRKN